jgi:hypothetical protein
MNRMKSCTATLIIFCYIVCAAYAEDTKNKCDSCSLSEFSSEYLKSLEAGGTSPQAVISNALEQPDTINKVLNDSLKTDTGWQFLKDLNLKFKTFQANDGTESLGFNYNFSKDIKKKLLSDDNSSQSGYAISINLEGNVAFDEQTNPTNFLTSNVSIHLFRSQGGVVSNNTSTERFNRLNSLEDKMAEIENPDDLFISTEYKAFSSEIISNLSNQYYFDVSFIGGLESNQSFSEKQYYYGGQLGFDAKAWNPHTALARYNIFDWPFAAIRWLSGNDESFSPRGSTIPTLLAGIDLVDPQSGVIKEIQSGKSTFPRFRTEISFRTPLNKYDKVFFEANYRYYQDINASADIKDSGLSKFEYFVTAITMSNGMFVSYSSGRLPFDLQKEQVYELGFKFNL